MGKKIDIEDFERIKHPETYDRAKKVFDRYQEIMLEYYRKKCKEVPGHRTRSDGVTSTDQGATDTGFHRVITEAIMEGLGWIKDGLVDLFVDVQHILERSDGLRPSYLYAMTQLNIQSVHE